MKQLQNKGYGVLVLDNLVNGHLSATGNTLFVEADIIDKRALKQAFQYRIDAVMHFAALSIVGESVTKN